MTYFSSEFSCRSFGGLALNLAHAQVRNSSLNEVSNNDLNEVKTRKTDSWAYHNKGDLEAGERCCCLLFTWILTSFVSQ